MYPAQLWDPQQLSINATSNFTGGPNPSAAVADSGSGIADLLLGAARSTAAVTRRETRSHHYYIGFYAQDLARLTRRLTVTYGLRASYETGDVENQNQLNYIDLKSPSPLAGQVAGIPEPGGRRRHTRAERNQPTNCKSTRHASRSAPGRRLCVGLQDRDSRRIRHLSPSAGGVGAISQCPAAPRAPSTPLRR